MSTSTKEQTSDICCPEFDPTQWEDKVFNWENKRFIKEKVLTFHGCSILQKVLITI